MSWTAELLNWKSLDVRVSHPTSQLTAVPRAAACLLNLHFKVQKDDVFVGVASPRRRPSSEATHPSALPLGPNCEAAVDRGLRFVCHYGALVAIQVSANEHLSCVMLLMMMTDEMNESSLTRSLACSAFQTSREEDITLDMKIVERSRTMLLIVVLRQ